MVMRAALLALGEPPHARSGRGFALQRWPCFEPGAWASVAAEVAERSAAAVARRGGVQPILGSDRDAGAVQVAAGNARRAGVAELVVFRQCAISDVAEPTAARGLLLTNPPWGLRSAVGAGSPRDLYARLGQLHAGRFGGWDLAVLANDQGLARQAGGKLQRALSLSLGGQRAAMMASEDACDPLLDNIEPQRLKS